MTPNTSPRVVHKRLWHRLALGGLAPTLLLGAVAFWTELHYLHQARDWRRLSEACLQAQVSLGEARRGEKDFLLRDRYNPEFLASGASPNVARQQAAVANIVSNLTALRRSPLADAPLESAHRQIGAYAEAFGEAVRLVRNAGPQAGGAEAELRTAAQSLWAQVLTGSTGQELVLNLRAVELSYLAAPTRQRPAAGCRPGAGRTCEVAPSAGPIS